MLKRFRVGLCAGAAFVTFSSGVLAADNASDASPDPAAKDRPASAGKTASPDHPLVAQAGTQRPVQSASAAEAHEIVTVTARRREENVQDVPIAMSVIGGDTLDKTGTFNINQLTQLTPSLQFSSTNARNTNFTIRGLGSSLGLANDGLEPGVGLYIDQVYYARPAAAVFDFVDIDQVEVLRGPQGTLFGKNTTGGVISLTTRAPSFTPDSQFEATGGNLGYYQAKASVSGPILDDLAGRLSLVTTHHNGYLTNVSTDGTNNDLSSISVRGQLLYTPANDLKLRLSVDYSEQRTNCCTQVYVAVSPTLKPAASRYAALAAGLNYTPPSTNPFDRVTDVNSPVKANSSIGGVSLIGDWDLGFATVTSVSAYRWWDWLGRNDRDYTRLSILTQSHNPVQQNQYSQELRIASSGKNAIDYVAGLYAFGQELNAQPVAQYGADAAWWLLGPPPNNPSNLLDGYRSDAVGRTTTSSEAIFAEATWNATEALSVSLGARYTWKPRTAPITRWSPAAWPRPTRHSFPRRTPLCAHSPMPRILATPAHPAAPISPTASTTKCLAMCPMPRATRRAD